MPVQWRDAPAIEKSYKAREVEGFLDLHLYRKLGYRLALIFARLQMSPAQVTWCGAAFGILAGHLYYYPDLRLNLVGMFLHVVANVFDNADGQLARLTKQGSRSGRALDGLADHLVFVSIYAHLALRYVAGGGSEWIWLVALASGVSHSVQSALADYFRTAWLFFAEGKARAEFDASGSLRADFDRLAWRSAPWRKFLLRLYLNYTREQEWFAPALVRLKAAVAATSGERVAAAYRERSKPLIKWQNLLATNPRMILLFLLLVIGQPVWYFFAELTVFNLVLVILLQGQNLVCRRILNEEVAAYERVVD